MKTLLLTSAGMDVKDELLKILPRPASQMKLVHIITASKPEPEAGPYVEKDREAMRSLGFNVTDYDIEGKTENQLINDLADFDIIVVQGGNTFYLLRAAKESCFDKVVKNLINKGMIYVGVSAGTILACPTIETSGWKGGDKNIVGIENLAGLDLIPFNIFVHYEPSWDEVIKEESAKSKIKTRLLTNDQAFLVRDDQIELVGEQPEIVL